MTFLEKRCFGVSGHVLSGYSGGLCFSFGHHDADVKNDKTNTLPSIFSKCQFCYMTPLYPQPLIYELKRVLQVFEYALSSHLGVMCPLLTVSEIARAQRCQSTEHEWRNWNFKLVFLKMSFLLHNTFMPPALQLLLAEIVTRRCSLELALQSIREVKRDVL